METSSPNKCGGLWNSARSVPYNKEREKMLALMKNESVLTNLSKKHTDRGEKTSPQTSNNKKNPNLNGSANKRIAVWSTKRRAECCQNNYEEEKFHPRPSKNFAEEKRRLQDIMESGKQEIIFALPEKTPPTPDVVESEEKDPRQEVLNEIEERKQFLADMKALGQEGKYTGIINTQIAQKLHQLELMDRACSKKQGC